MTLDNRQNAATQAKKRWNARHYTQVKAFADPKVAAAFKAACADSGVSMAGALTQFMAEYSNTAKKRSPKPDYSTRRKRRAAVRAFAGQLAQIKAAEEESQGNIPDNLSRSVNYEIADEIISQLDDAIDILSSIY